MSRLGKLGGEESGIRYRRSLDQQKREERLHPQAQVANHWFLGFISPARRDPFTQEPRGGGKGLAVSVRNVQGDAGRAAAGKEQGKEQVPSGQMDFDGICDCARRLGTSRVPKHGVGESDEAGRMVEKEVDDANEPRGCTIKR